MIYAKIVEGTLYLTSEDDPGAIKMTEEEWLGLDLSRQYKAEANKIVAKNAEVVPEVSQTPSAQPPLPLALMLDRAGCGEYHKLDALWDAVAKNDRTKIDTLLKKDEEVRVEHDRLTKEYEAAQ